MRIAPASGLDPQPLLAAIAGGAHEDAARRDQREASAAGIDATPTFLIREEGRPAKQLTLNALTPASFRRAINALLK